VQAAILAIRWQNFCYLYYANYLAVPLFVENMFRNTIFIVVLFIAGTSCSTVKPASSGPAASTKQTSTSSSGSSIEFINNIAINSNGQQDQSRSSHPGTNKKAPVKTVSYNDRPGGAIEDYSALQFKFAILENASVEDLSNSKLLSFMDYWYGTPYHYGGSTREGIDCSAFAILLMSSVYGVTTLPRTSKEQYEATRRISRSELQEGDLVFFHTLGKRRTVTHVGVYLRNNKFIHASVSGVMISDMNDGYYDKHYIGAGRIPDPGQAEGAAQAGPTPGR
jgi:lipoprotein Spr